MIASLTGILKIKNPTDILIDVGGVGYAVTIPLSTFEHLGDTGNTVTLLTHLQVKEDAFQLYGFLSEDERFLFRLLISVSGIGPRIAIGILSGISIKDLRSHIIRGNVAALTSIPGVGKKTAERLVLELKEKIARTMESDKTAGTPSEDCYKQALLALTSLGYSRQVAEKALQQIQGDNLPLEEMIKRALRHTAAQ